MDDDRLTYICARVCGCISKRYCMFLQIHTCWVVRLLLLTWDEVNYVLLVHDSYRSARIILLFISPLIVSSLFFLNFMHDSRDCAFYGTQILQM